ncbi:type IV secretion system protein [Hyphococcus sp.]|jgi:type IV secretion system protein VirB6|uniref:type IV secretion system protein n=1 Tax=Hyphococcus sp. TaxID=2038636 RepID=UPI003D0E11DC
MTAGFCTSPVDGMIAPLLNEVDCQIATYVETTYGTLFGPFGFLEPVLTGALTLYIGFYGFQLITGRGGLSLSGLAPKILLIGLVLAFATRWGAYQAVFLNLFYGGADEIAAAMLGGGHDSVFLRLDAVLKEIIRLANEWNMTSINQADPFGAGAATQQAMPEPALPKSAGAVNLLWFSAVTLALSTAGVLIIAKVLLGVLLAVGPLLILTALFPGTRGLFEGWLKTLALYALVAAFATALAGGLMQLAEPMVIEISDMRASGLADPQPVFVLAVTAFIFALLMAQVLRMCGRLTSGWRLPSGQAPQNSAQLQAETAASSARPSNDNARLADMVVAVERSGGASRTRSVIESAEATAPAASAYGSRRTRQTYRGFGAASMKGKFA